MTTLNVNTIKPAGATLTLGESGDSVIFADDVKVNTVKDVGDNTLWISNGSGVLSSVKAGIGGGAKLLNTTVISTTTDVQYTSAYITSAYKEYVLKFIALHPVNDGAAGVNVYVTTDGGTNWENTNTTSTVYVSAHAENNSEVELALYTSYCLHQSTDPQKILSNIGNAADECGVGEYHIFNPASALVKNFYAVTQTVQSNNYTSNQYAAGYYNTTSAINGIRIRMGSGDMQEGIIKLYGINS